MSGTEQTIANQRTEVAALPASDPAPLQRPDDSGVPATIRQALYLVFLWCLVGIALSYGVRVWNDVPIHSSFIPFIGIAFSAILAFAVVMAFRSVAGEIDVQFGQVKFKGAAGPVLFWSVCFLAVAYGMSLLGIGDVARAPPPAGYKSCSVGEIASHQCPLNKPETSKPSAPQT